jgi:hypothetical protein
VIFHKGTVFLMERTDKVLLCLFIAAEGDISQMPSVLNGTNRYSTAVFVYSSRG